MEIKKVVLKLNIHDDKDKQKALRAVSSLEGINSVEVDMKESKMTIIGDVDPVAIVKKLRKQWNAQIFTVGPPKEPEKKDGDKKEGDKKGGDKKDDKQQVADLIKACNAYGYRPPPPVYFVRSVEEDPCSCVIC